VLMLSSNNILSPADGRPLVTPTQDMIIGAYYLTEMVEGAKGEGKVFRRLHEIERAVDAGELSLHAPITYRVPELLETPANGSAATYTPTTAGRVLFNDCLPEGFPWVQTAVKKRDMGRIVDELAANYPKAVVAESLDRIKNLCFHYAARSGITISVDDIKTPPEKKEILDRHEKEADKVETQFRRGIIT